MSKSSKRSVVVPLHSEDPAEVDEILHNVMAAIHRDSQRLVEKTQLSELSAEERKALNEYARSMVLIRKDDRSAEQVAKGGLEQLSDEELQAELSRLTGNAA